MIWLIDKSAFVRLASSPDAPEWASRMQRGMVCIPAITRLEVGSAAQSGAELRDFMARPPFSVMPVQNATPPMENRAIEVQVMLADKGLHRGPGAPDLLVAAIAELAGLTLLHLDKEFELIAEVTGQPVERLRMA
ncbi:PIN domain-containing protein [Nocardiopsis oceani]